MQCGDEWHFPPPHTPPPPESFYCSGNEWFMDRPPPLHGGILASTVGIRSVWSYSPHLLLKLDHRGIDRHWPELNYISICLKNCWVELFSMKDPSKDPTVPRILSRRNEIQEKKYINSFLHLNVKGIQIANFVPSGHSSLYLFIFFHISRQTNAKLSIPSPNNDWW